MNILANTWSGAFFNPGGGETQLLETVRHLRGLVASIDLYNQWAPQQKVDIFHQFSIQPGVEFPMYEYRQKQTKTVLSTILWANLDRASSEHRRISKLFELSDLLFTNSNAESQKISRDFDIDIARFHKTRNGVADTFSTLATSQDFKVAFNIRGDFVLSVANIDRRKNTHRLIDACAELGKSLVLAGHIRDREYFDEFARDKKAKFNFVGPISDPEMLKSAYQQCAVFALPSLCETPGIAALEAASQGSKVVITREGCAKEYFGERATYVDPLDHRDITSGLNFEINQLRDPSELAQHVRSNFTWRLAAQDVFEGYKKALGVS